MPRYIRARRTSSNSSNTELTRLRDQFIRQLTREAEASLKQLSQQFSQDLERQSSSFLSGLLDGNSPDGAAGQGFTGFVSSASRYLFSRPRIKESTRESSRSEQESERFRLSQSQLLAETNAMIARGEKNS